MFDSILLYSCLFAVSFHVATSLEAVQVGKIPSARQSIAAVYDGDDSVFLIGGQNETVPRFDEILHYNLTSGEVNAVGTFPDGIYRGAAIQSENGDLYYFGGYDQIFADSGLWKFPLGVFNNPQNIANLSEHCAYATIVTFTPDTWYLIGGDNFPNGGISPIISKFTVGTEILEPVANFSVGVYGHSSAVSGDSIYFFGGSNSSFLLTQDITKFSPADNSVESLDLKLDLELLFSSAVGTRDDIYIVGGRRASSGLPEEHSISRFTPSLNRLEHLEVSNFPRGLFLAGTVYIPKLNRIYTFGGLDERWWTPLDDIYYIDLSE